MPAFADRLGRVQVAASVQMTIRARELRAQGVDIVSLTLGEPNFASPRHAIEAAHEAALKGDTKYPPQDGTPALKQAIQRKFKRDSGLDYALDEICVTNGGKQAIFNALLATVNPGDEAVIPVPSWSAYALMTKLCDGEPVFVTCPQNNGFKPRAEDIDAAITPKTKWLILNNPNNPTGACCSAAELRAIADVMVKHPHVWIMSDDMYEHLVFDGFTHATIAAGGARTARPHGDDQRCIEGLCDDRMAHRLRRRAEEPDPGDGEHAGPGDGRRVHRRPGGRGGGAGRAAGRRGRADRRVPQPARHGGGDAERLQRHQLPQAGRRVLRVSQRRRLHRQDDGGRAAGWRPIRTCAWRCSRRRMSRRCMARRMA